MSTLLIFGHNWDEGSKEKLTEGWTDSPLTLSPKPADWEDSAPCVAECHVFFRDLMEKKLHMHVLSPTLSKGQLNNLS